MGSAIVDSSCLIVLNRLGKLDLLKQIFETILYPPAVQSEVNFETEWISIQVPSPLEVSSLLEFKIDPGETEVIALALSNRDAVVILDDKKARNFALELGLLVTGTLGLLLKAKQKSLISAVKPLLDSLKEIDFYMNDFLYQDILRRAGEE